MDRQKGIGHIELLLAGVVVLVLGLTGWTVAHHRHQVKTASGNAGQSKAVSSKLNGVGSSPNPAAGTDNASLQADLNNINHTSNQVDQDLNSTNSSLNDSSTFTSFPQ